MGAAENRKKRASNARPYDIDFSADQAHSLQGAAQILHQISTISRDAKRYGLFRSLDTGQAQKTYTYILKAPPKKRPLSRLRRQLPLRRGGFLDAH